MLKEVARRYLPSAIVDRPKVGFKVPLDAWFRDGLRPLARDLLTGRLEDLGTAVAHAASLGWDVDRPLVVAVAVLFALLESTSPAVTLAELVIVPPP